MACVCGAVSACGCACVCGACDARHSYYKERPPHIVGGGWNVSSGVRSAVKEFAGEHGLPLHVEQGEAR